MIGRRWSRFLGRSASATFLAAIALAAPVASLQAQGGTAVGSSSAVQTATVAITTAGTPTTISVLTRGVSGLDYQVVTPNTDPAACALNTAYTAGQTCTVQYTFNPTRPGNRAGGISLADTNGVLLGNLYLSSKGTGPQVAFPPTSATLPTTLTAGATRLANGLTLDAAGDIFFVNNTTVYEIVAVGGSIPATPTVNQIATGFTTASAVVIDGSGNLFVADSTAGTISEILSVGGAIPAGATARVVASGFTKPTSIRVDGSGDVYVADGTAIKEVIAANGVIPATPTVNTLITGVSVTAISLDGSGDVFFNNGTTQISELPFGLAIPVPVATVSNSVSGIAIDGSGDLYVASSAGKAVYEIVAVNGVIPASPTILTLGTSYSGPVSVAVDANGNIFVGDTPATPAVLELNVQTPPTLTFTSTAATTTSSDSPQTLTLANIGNTALSFPVPTTNATNPFPSTSYTVTGGTCPQLTTTSAAAGTLAAGTTCTYSVSFTPATVGTMPGTLVISDTNLNASGASQTVTLAGGLSTPVITVSPVSAVVDVTPITLTASVAYTGLMPTGTVSFTVNSTSVSASCSGTSSPLTCTGSYSPSALVVGSYAVTATILADTSTNTATGSGTLSITAGTPVVTVTNPNPSIAIDASTTFTASVTPTSGVMPTGAISFTVGSTAIANCTSVALSSGSATCTTSSLPLGSPDVITATIAADSNFTTAFGTFNETVGMATPGVSVSADNATISVNGSVKFTASITPTSGTAVPSGAVTFKFGTTTLCANVALSSGIATCTTTSLPAGTPDVITATIAADSNFASNSGTFNETVNMVTPGVSVSADNSTISVNGSVKFTASVTSPTSGILPTGAVTFKFGTTTLCSSVPLNSGTASCTTTSLPAGSPDAITATIAADSNFNTATGNFNETVNTVLPVVTVTSNSASVAVNGSVIFNAAVTPNSGITPTGAVTFKFGTTTLCSSVALSGGNATCTTNVLTAGTDTITATSAADSNFTTASGTFNQPVTQVQPVLTVTSNATSPTVDQAVTFTATLSTSPAFVTIPGATVSFSNHGAVIPGCATAAVDSGTHAATCTTGTLVAPSDIITATYLGDTNYKTATSPNFGQSVSPDSTVTTVVSTLPTTAVVNQSVTLTATVTPTGSAAGDLSPTGNVTFIKGGSNVCAAVVVTAVANGTATATCTTAFTSAFASTSINVAYSSDTSFSASNTSVAQTVLAAPTTTSVSSNLPTSSVNQSVNLTATVTPTNTGAAYPGTASPQSGSLVFSDSAAAGTFCPTTITGGVLSPTTCAHVFTTSGTHLITATFTSTDPNFNNSTVQNSLNQTVGSASTTIAITNASSTTPVVNQSVTFNAVFQNLQSGGGQPSGTVTYYDSLPAAGAIAACTALTVNPTTGAIPSCTETVTVAGTHIITASFASVNNGAYASLTQGQSPSLAQIVSQGATSAALTSPTATTSTVNALQTFSATVAAVAPANSTPTAPTGTVNFTYGASSVLICSASIVTSGGVNTASCATQQAFTQAGSYQIVATYAGDTNFTGTTSPKLTQTVGAATNTITITSPTVTATTVDVLQTYSAKITPANTGSTSPTGTVAFTYGNPLVTICTATVTTVSSVTTATCSSQQAFLQAGTYGITANYSGDSNFSTASSSQLTQTVSATGTALTIFSGGSNTPPANVQINTPVTFSPILTTAVSDTGLTLPTGLITITDSANPGVALCSGNVSSTGTVTCPPYSFLTGGGRTLTAKYAGDTNFAPATITVPINIGVATPSIVLTASQSTSVATQTVTFTATITSTGGNVPTNATLPVSFSVTQGSTVYTCNSVNQVVSATADTASCPVTFPAAAAGVVAVAATYNGDSSYNKVTSTTLNELVQNFSVSLVTAPKATGITMAQGSTAIPDTNLTDAFYPGSTIQFSVVPTAGTGFTDVTNTVCSITAVGGTTAATGLACTSTPAGAVTVTATGAPVGVYTLTLTASDALTSSLSHSLATTLTILSEPTPITSPNVGTFSETFTLPSTLTSTGPFACNASSVAVGTANGYSLTGTSGAVLNLAEIGVTCSAVTANSSGGYTFTITAGNAGATAKLEMPNNHRDNNVLAALYGAPFLLLFGFLPAMRKYRKQLLRGLAMLALAAIALQGTGCSSGGFTRSSQTFAVAGSYLISIVNSSGATVAEVPIVINN